MSKRQDKQARREKRRTAEHKRRERREERLHEALYTREGLRRLDQVDSFFREERGRKALDPLFWTVLDSVRDLKLLLLQQHKHTLAAGIRAMLEKHAAVGEVGDQYPDLVQSCNNISQARLGSKLEKIEQLDELSMYWLVFGDMKYLDPIFDIAINEEHPWSDAAVEVMAKFEANFEEVAEWCQTKRGVRELDEDEQQDLEDVQALAQELRNSPQWHRIVFVRLENGTIAIGTQDEGPIPEAPLHWREKPVMHIVATPVERRRHQKWLDDMDDAI